MKLERFLKLILFLSCVTAFMTWVQISHGDTIGEKFGQSTDSNDVFEWTDGYVAPHLTCEMEALNSTMANSQAQHDFHIPRTCHLEMAQYLAASAQNFEQMEHALYHQILSGRNVRYNMAFPIHRKAWVAHMKADPQRQSLTRISDEMDRVNALVYDGAMYASDEVTQLRMSYGFVHKQYYFEDFWLPLGFLFVVFYLSGRILLGNKFW